MSFQDEWEEIVRLVRSYALRKYGDPSARGITIHLSREERHYEPFPPWAPVPGDPTTVRQAGAAWASGPEPKHLSDFQQIYWPGLGVFTLTPMQALVVRRLWQARDAGDPEVREDELLRAADSDSPRLVDVFKRSPAWSRLVIKGVGAAAYRLPDVPEPE